MDRETNNIRKKEIQTKLSYRPPPKSDHLLAANTFWGPIFSFYYIKLPLNNGHYFWVPRVVVVHRFDCKDIFLIVHTRTRMSRERSNTFHNVTFTKTRSIVGSN